MAKNDMVSAGTIFEIAKKTSPKTFNLNDSLKFAVDCYESGMIEVLRGIAYNDFESRGPVAKSKYTKKMDAQCQEKYEELRNDLRWNANIDDSQTDLLKKYDDSFRDLMEAEATDYYIEGFIMGYRYLKSQIEFAPNTKGEYANGESD